MSPSLTSRVSQPAESRRRFQGQGKGNALISWLQRGGKGESARKRIIAIVASVQEITKYSLELRRANEGDVPGESDEREKLEDMQDHLQSLMRFYEGGRIGLSSVDEFGHGLFKLYSGKKSRASLDEWHALDLVISLSRDALLHRVRQCETCRDWFYARFDHQLSCKDECRRRKYRSSEKWKEHHRNKQREYYHLKKYANVL